jgi:hypothetical protein
MPDFKTNFDTPSPTQMADISADVSMPNVSGAKTQHGDVGVPHGPEGLQGVHVVDPTE